ncbi:hypothetical protein BJY52DRAFT_274669 [Lactarius psammicola]|nr:hypothetical protein BJY52DRAFT_274669 [Lactarius psammicola]
MVSGSFLLYEAPPSGTFFDDFLAIPITSKNVSTTSFSDLVLSYNRINPSLGSIRIHINFYRVPVTRYLPAVFDAFVNQTEFWCARVASLDKTAAAGSAVEPFDSGVFSHGSGSAYPPNRFQAVSPSAIGPTWTNASIYGIITFGLRKESGAIYAVALAGGWNVSHAATYMNYARGHVGQPATAVSSRCKHDCR